MFYKKNQIEKNAKILVNVCGQVRPGERVLIIADKFLKPVGQILKKQAEIVTDKVKMMIAPKQKIHGMEPPPWIAKEMLKSDVIFGVSKSSMVHTRARLDATRNGARYLSLADYSFKQLAKPSLTINFFQWARVAKRIKEILDFGKEIRVINCSGTDIKLKIQERKANFCPAFCAKPGMIGSPPDIETNIAPLENKSEGIIAVDGSIPCREIGLIKKELLVKIRKSRITGLNGNSFQINKLKNIFSGQSRRAAVLAEFGMGLNPKARLCGMMLEDEGCLGTAHFGFGSNWTIGGKNRINFHLDFVIRKPTVWVDGQLLMRTGKLVGKVLN